MGIRPLEVPLSSAVCRTPSFAKFASTLMRGCPTSIKSTTIPSRAIVSDMASKARTTRCPIWAATRVGTRRRFGRGDAATSVGAGSLSRWLADPSRLWAESDRLGELVGPAGSWPEQWQALESRGIRIRTRALTTTLFTRLYLADLFMHGLGGGKYDEVTDDLIRAFVGIEPPRYLVATATLLLPLPRHPEAVAELAKLQRDGRDLWWNPQRHVAPTAAASRIAERQAALELPESTHAERVERFHRLQETTAALRPLVADQRTAVEKRRRIEDRGRARGPAPDRRIAGLRLSAVSRSDDPRLLHAADGGDRR